MPRVGPTGAQAALECPCSHIPESPAPAWPWGSQLDGYLSAECEQARLVLWPDCPCVKWSQGLPLAEVVVCVARATCVHAKSFSHVQLCAILWTAAARLLCPWDSPGKKIGVGCHSLLQGIFPTQGLIPGLLHCRQILYQLSHLGSLQLNNTEDISLDVFQINHSIFIYLKGALIKALVGNIVSFFSKNGQHKVRDINIVKHKYSG